VIMLFVCKLSALFRKTPSPLSPCTPPTHPPTRGPLVQPSLGRRQRRSWEKPWWRGDLFGRQLGNGGGDSSNKSTILKIMVCLVQLNSILVIEIWLWVFFVYFTTFCFISIGTYWIWKWFKLLFLAQVIS
jgi:hypothetical protein